MNTIKHYCDTDLQTDILLKNTQKNVFQKPSLAKIIVNIGVKEANINNNKILIPLLITKILTHQQPLPTKAKRSIANFKLRQGKIIGCKSTLRNKNMYNFLERLIHIILPQITDLKKQKYKNRKPKNYISLGIEDSAIFYELNNQYDLLTQKTGLNINICSNDNKLSKDNLFFSGLKIRFQ